MRKVEILPTWDCEAGYTSVTRAEGEEIYRAMRAVRNYYED